MTQFSEKHQQQSAPASQQSTHPAPKAESTSLSSQTSKLNLSVKVPQKAAGPKLDSVQLKSNPNAAAEPGQMTDMDVINTVTHIIKSATVHPLGSSSANRDLRNQKANLENNKETRTKAADQAAKNQQIIEQDKVQQKNAIERANTKEGPGQATKETKADIKTDKVIKTQTVKNDAITEHKPIEQGIKEIQRFKEEHARSQSAANANVSALASRNTSTEGEKESLSRDLVRDRTSEKTQQNEKRVEAVKTEFLIAQLRAAVEARPEVRMEIPNEIRQEIKPEIRQELKQEVRQAENRAIEIQRQFVQAAAVQANARNEVQQQEVEDDIFDSWISRDDRRRVARKKKKSVKQQLTKEAKRVLRKMTPLERRKARLKREKARRMRKRSRRKNRTLVFR